MDLGSRNPGLAALTFPIDFPLWAHHAQISFPSRPSPTSELGKAKDTKSVSATLVFITTENIAGPRHKYLIERLKPENGPTGKVFEALGRFMHLTPTNIATHLPSRNLFMSSLGFYRLAFFNRSFRSAAIGRASRVQNVKVWGARTTEVL